MESHNYLICIVELEELILSYLDPILDWNCLMLTNKHFYGMIKENPIRTELSKFFSDEKSIYIDINVTVSKIQDLFFKTCYYGNLNVVKYFWRYYDTIDLYSCNDMAFYLGCSNGYIDIAKFLSEIDVENKIDIHFENDLLFLGLCEDNHFEVAKWLYQLCLNNKSYGKIDIREHGNLFFVKCCSRGHLEIAKWIYQLSTYSNCENDTHNIINIHSHDNYAFERACKCNYLEIVKFLCSLVPDESFSSSRDLFENLFRISCKYGHLRMAQWLYSLLAEKGNQINLPEQYSLFKQVCRRNHVKVAKWLSTLCNSFRVEIVDDKINRFWI